LGYIKSLLDGSHPDQYKRVIGKQLKNIRSREIRQQGAEDLVVLRELINMENPTIRVRFVSEYV
jgi:hypothetical protein